MDFRTSRTRRGGPVRILNIDDEFTRLALGCRIDFSIGTSDVMTELEELFLKDGKPKTIRCDNGREFVAATLISWLGGVADRLLTTSTLLSTITARWIGRSERPQP